eukprot:3859321-Pyramimonas_sp.AAC.1
MRYPAHVRNHDRYPHHYHHCRNHRICSRFGFIMNDSCLEALGNSTPSPEDDVLARCLDNLSNGDSVKSSPSPLGTCLDNLPDCGSSSISSPGFSPLLPT